MHQNYLNPFNPSTRFVFDIPKNCHVKIDIYNAMGHHVEALLNEDMGAGQYTVDWDAVSLPEGVYFYKMTTPEFVKMRKCLFVK